MPIQLPDLPYDLKALEPHISEKTLNFHYDKHHRGYVDKLNATIERSDFADCSLEVIVRRSFQSGDAGIFNNAAQVWNHTFLWHSMSPNGGQRATGPLAEAIERDFGNQDDFSDEFVKAAKSCFGSGWTWLVADGGQLKIVSTSNADTPLVRGLEPLLTLDVWEHAYYLDYQNDRGKYVNRFLRELINWDFAASNYEARRAAA